MSADSEHLRLDYRVRGFQAGVAIRRGDLGSLRTVASMASRFWGGALTLIAPITEAGSLDRHTSAFAETLHVDSWFWHPSAPDALRDAAMATLGASGPFDDLFLENALHPYEVAPPTPMRAEGFLAPSGLDADHEVMSTVVWGAPRADDPRSSGRLLETSASGPMAFRVLVEDQARATSPLAHSVRGLATVSQMMPIRQQALFLLSTPPSFDELVSFWNYRSRMSTLDERPAAIGVTMEMLAADRVGETLRSWATPPSYGRTTPNVTVVARQAQTGFLQAFLEREGFQQLKSSSGPSWTLGGSSPQGPLTFEFGVPVLGGRAKRGAHGQVLTASLAGRIQVDLASPQPFTNHWGGRVLLSIGGLPTALPLTRSAARRMIDPAECNDGDLTIATMPMKSWPQHPAARCLVVTSRLRT